LKLTLPAQGKTIILSKCTTYSHATAGEHFRIAPLEALAPGLTPVIPRRSRTWTDICNKGEYCYSYMKPEPKEIAESIRRALEKPLTAPTEHLKKFTPEKIHRKDIKGG